MKTKLINFRVSPEEYERFTRAAVLCGKTVSEVCRETLERIAKRVDKATEEGGL